MVYEYYMYSCVGNNKMHKHLVIYSGIYDRPDEHNAIAAIVKNMLFMLNNQKTGIERVRERVKIGTGSNKKTHTFRKIIHISDKKYCSEMKPFSTGKTIDWTSRWFVRGHWRKHSGLGKDRAGDRIIENYTWITEHCKGPEGLPLIDKTRLVD